MASLFVVVALIVLTGVVYSLIQSSTSFKELMSDQVYDTEKISYIRIEKMGSPYDDENSVEITDPATIDRIINSFSNAKLWKTENYGRGTEYMIWVNVEYTPSSYILQNRILSRYLRIEDCIKNIPGATGWLMAMTSRSLKISLRKSRGRSRFPDIIVILITF